MNRLRKIAYVIGIIACLSAAEGLNRFGGFVSRLGGRDAPFYIGMLIASLFCAVLFILAWVNKLARIMKWIGLVCLLGSIALMLAAPAFPVNQQVIVSLIVAFICLIFASASPAKKNE